MRKWEEPTISLEGKRILTKEEMKINNCFWCDDRGRGTTTNKAYQKKRVNVCPFPKCPYAEGGAE